MLNYEIYSTFNDDFVFQIHERDFPSHMSSRGPLEESGSFVIDKYAGRDTDFSVFALLDREYGFLKSVSVRDRRGKQYRGIHDGLSAYHILSVHRVPFEPVRKIRVICAFLLVLSTPTPPSLVFL